MRGRGLDTAITNTSGSRRTTYPAVKDKVAVDYSPSSEDDLSLIGINLESVGKPITGVPHLLLESLLLD